MTEDIAPDVAETSPSPEGAEPSPAPEESSPQEVEPTVAAEPGSPPEIADPESEAPKQRAKERIEQVIAERNATRVERDAAKEYGEYWRQEALRKQIPVAVEKQPTPAPTMEQFDHDPEKWAEAHTKWAEDRAMSLATAAAKTQLDVQAKANRQADLQVKWSERAAKFAEDHPDYLATVSNPTIKLTTEMIEAMAESERGPDIAYNLSKDPAKAARISRMTPVQQAAAIGRLESEVNKPAPKPQPTSAPQPPNPVGGQQPTVDIMKLPIEDYMAQERARLFSKRR